MQFSSISHETGFVRADTRCEDCFKEVFNI